MDKKTWQEKTKDIQPGSIVLVWGTDWISKIIQWYQRWEAKDLQEGPSHVETYWGSGDNMVVSAEWNGVRKMSFNRHQNKKVRVEVYHLKDMTVTDMQIIKAASLSSVGKLYDYKGLVSFLTNIKVIYDIVRKKITPSDMAEFCSENTANSFGYAGIKISRKKAAGETTPDDIYRYISNSDKWERSFLHDSR